MKDSRKKATVIVVSCLSGGSGKTTTVLNLASMLSERSKTLAIDFDPQGNLSQWLGCYDLSESATIAETVIPDDAIAITEIVRRALPTHSPLADLWLAPSDYSLTRAGELISTRPGREKFLSRAIKPILEEYDFVVIDSLPTKGNLTYNAILAADWIIIPTECTDKGVRGVISTINLIRELEEIDFKTPKILGVLPTKDQWSGANQTIMSRTAISSLQKKLAGVHIFSSLRYSTKVQRANHGSCSLEEAGFSKLAQPYCEIVEKLLTETDLNSNGSISQKEAIEYSYTN